MVKKVLWSFKAQMHLEKAYQYILLDSFQSAEKIKKEILSSTNKLTNHPEVYPLDKYKVNNDGTFRAFELYKFRIAYRVTEDEIIILRIRHTSMEPKGY